MLHCRYVVQFLMSLIFSVVCLVTGDFDSKLYLLCFYSWVSVACIYFMPLPTIVGRENVMFTACPSVWCSLSINTFFL